MFFGQTYTAKAQTCRAAREDSWKPAFAWRPVHLITGEWAWLERLERCSYWAHHINVNAPRTTIGMWCFRRPVQN